MKQRGFTMVEILVVIAVIGILASVMFAAFSGVRDKARDVKRKAELSQIGQFLMMSCYLPDAGTGEYDLVLLAQEILNKNPQYANYLRSVPRDPRSGTETESKYIYIVNAEGTKCALYANLENSGEQITLPITVPTPGGGKGTFEAESSGWNGTQIYYQVSN
jgi:prepilin-type N-terminal cleavage/methylation domain-containing protein